MRLKQIDVRNFRLLHDVNVILEPSVTVIVGRNNSGKTSLIEIMKRLLDDGTPTFRLEDFSFLCFAQFWDSYQEFKKDEPELSVRKLLPSIQLRLTFEYSATEVLGILTELVIDLNEKCNEAVALFTFSLRDGELANLFASLDFNESQKTEFYQALKERVPELFTYAAIAVDPGDPTNTKSIDLSTLRKLCMGGFVGAQRGLDDDSQRERAVIGKVLENLFSTAKGNKEDSAGHATATELETAVKQIQDKIGSEFNAKLDSLLPALTIFGYPGLGNSTLLTETTLDVTRLLTNHTRVKYHGESGINLPEAYNGLGTRNMILILLQLREYFKSFLATEPRPSVHLVFVEEPEVHLHPQMQEVFIRKLWEIAKEFTKEAGEPWPVQFVVSTHSSHVANEAHFETIRYFLSSKGESGIHQTKIKDLRKGLSKLEDPDRTFLHQYMTLTRCDLFFADKAVLIEGTTERLLLPKIVRILDKVPESQKLGSQYLSVVEVGGAYAHIFFDLIDYLELKTLVITDIDTIGPTEGAKDSSCQVALGTTTSNACITRWFGGGAISKQDLLGADESKRTTRFRRLAYQCSESIGGPCGRSFEDAFMLANPSLFEHGTGDASEIEARMYAEAKSVKKSTFALKFALSEDEWTVPKYIREGLAWLAQGPAPNIQVDGDSIVEAAAESV